MFCQLSLPDLELTLFLDFFYHLSQPDLELEVFYFYFYHLSLILVGSRTGSSHTMHNLNPVVMG